MNDLIEQLERASGPDREIDALIAIATEATPAEAFRPCAAVDVGTFGVGSYGYWTAPAYTSSIDAALTLVPEGFDYDVATLYGKPQAYVMWQQPADADMAKQLSCEKGSQVSWAEHAKAATCAIALCIAALKARPIPSTMGTK